MILDTADRILMLGLGEGITVTPLDYSVEYEDKIIERIIPATLLGRQTSGASQIICPAPADNTRRLITELNVCNLDSVPHKVIVFMYDGLIPATYSIHEGSLTAGQNLHYNQYNGWEIL